MRRRQVYAEQATETLRIRIPATLADFAQPWTLTERRIDPPNVAPGSCPKCLRHIGRGVAMHKKRCNGAVSPAVTHGPG